MNLDEIIKDVKKYMSEKRYTHSLSVMKRIEELAKIYGVDIETAKKVGIAHDIAKEMTEEESFKYAKENDIYLDELEKEVPYLLHGKIGADMTKKLYGFTENMQKAIMYHTTGNPEMDMLANKTEENRKFDDFDIEYEREFANQNIDGAIIFMLEEGIKSHLNKKKLIHPDSLITRNTLLIEMKKC